MGTGAAEASILPVVETTTVATSASAVGVVTVLGLEIVIFKKEVLFLDFCDERAGVVYRTISYSQFFSLILMIEPSIFQLSQENFRQRTNINPGPHPLHPWYNWLKLCMYFLKLLTIRLPIMKTLFLLWTHPVLVLYTLLLTLTLSLQP